MPVKLDIGSLEIAVTAVPLQADAFAPFGEVIQNPRPEVHPSQYRHGLPFAAISANQGSAIKYQHVTRMRNLLPSAPSGRPGEAVMNMFVCAARQLSTDPASANPTPESGSGVFAVEILERHPYTPQTFIPLGTDPATRYLIIVAPSLPPGKPDADLPVPDGSSLPGRGLPDLGRLRAFIAAGDQAVTYGAGTWHAPMVALGEQGTAVGFVVVQFANGVAIEDCQEVVFKTGELRGAVTVRVLQKLRAVKL